LLGENRQFFLLFGSEVRIQTLIDDRIKLVVPALRAVEEKALVVTGLQRRNVEGSLHIELCFFADDAPVKLPADPVTIHLCAIVAHQGLVSRVSVHMLLLNVDDAAQKAPDIEHFAADALVVQIKLVGRIHCVEHEDKDLWHLFDPSRDDMVTQLVRAILAHAELETVAADSLLRGDINAKIVLKCGE
jgi:hypothetical protein